eukprot:TRINITY_DN6038_c0_g1_i1.p1 TRINITY_DN6038_c0_g1~~TRINITY_DN6038_c0_g1_i1.p1  ORF type:complete len:395 (+),score=25.79 TRINITY_DN6038_c0_g1_i1:39-1187(+)
MKARRLAWTVVDPAGLADLKFVKIKEAVAWRCLNHASCAELIRGVTRIEREVYKGMFTTLRVELYPKEAAELSYGGGVPYYLFVGNSGDDGVDIGGITVTDEMLLEVNTRRPVVIGKSRGEKIVVLLARHPSEPEVSRVDGGRRKFMKQITKTRPEPMSDEDWDQSGKHQIGNPFAETAKKHIISHRPGVERLLSNVVRTDNIGGLIKAMGVRGLSHEGLYQAVATWMVGKKTLPPWAAAYPLQRPPRLTQLKDIEVSQNTDFYEFHQLFSVFHALPLRSWAAHPISLPPASPGHVLASPTTPSNLKAQAAALILVNPPVSWSFPLLKSVVRHGNPPPKEEYLRQIVRSVLDGAKEFPAVVDEDTVLRLLQAQYDDRVLGSL